MGLSRDGVRENLKGASTDPYVIHPGPRRYLRQRHTAVEKVCLQAVTYSAKAWSKSQKKMEFRTAFYGQYGVQSKAFELGELVVVFCRRAVL